MTTKFSERDWDAVVADEEAEEKAEAAFLAVLQGRHDRVKAIKGELLSLEEGAGRSRRCRDEAREKVLLDEWKGLCDASLAEIDEKADDSLYHQSIAEFCDLRAACGLSLGRVDKKWGLMKDRGLPPGTIDKTPALELLAAIDRDLDRADEVA